MTLDTVVGPKLTSQVRQVTAFATSPQQSTGVVSPAQILSGLQEFSQRNSGANSRRVNQLHRTSFMDALRFLGLTLDFGRGYVNNPAGDSFPELANWQRFRGGNSGVFGTSASPEIGCLW